MKALENKINRITNESKRTDVLSLHEKLNEAEDAAQEKYDTEMVKLHEARQLLDHNSNAASDAA